MKKIALLLILLSFLPAIAALTDYEKEFGFPLDKPKHGKYFYLRELLTIDHDPQILNLKPDAEVSLRNSIIDQSIPTELDQIQLSDSTLVLDVDALNDLDLFSSLQMKNDLSEYDNINIQAKDYELTPAHPADYMLYTRMEIPPINKKEEKQLNIIPVTPESRLALGKVRNIVNNLAYQIDNLFLQEFKIIPQSGSIDFIITVSPQGIEAVSYKLSRDASFSQPFLRKAIATIKQWQLTSPQKIQYTLSRQYLRRN